MTSTRRFALAAAVALVPVLPGRAQAQADPDSAAVAEVVSAFHGALAASDGETALGLLTAEARILEGGGVETRDEYADHHLPADMAFAAAVQRERGPLHVTIRGDVAWAVSTTRTTGTYREREIDSRSAELMVLQRGPEGWRISAISWSSR